MAYRLKRISTEHVQLWDGDKFVTSGRPELVQVIAQGRSLRALEAHRELERIDAELEAMSKGLDEARAATFRRAAEIIRTNGAAS